MEQKNVNTKNRIVRRNYSRISGSLELPNLVEIQTDSYKWFIEEGIKEVFNEIYPIKNYNETISLEYVNCFFEEPKYDADESKDRGTNFAAKLQGTFRLVNSNTGDVKETDVYLGDFPLMTDGGTFIINGAERVIVSQLVRSPGAYFNNTSDKQNKTIFAGSIIPARGTWLEFENDSKNVLNVRIDRTRKIAGTILLRALGLSSDEDIYNVFGQHEYLMNTIEVEKKSGVVDQKSALLEIYNKLRPGEPATDEGATNLLYTRFFDPKRYDLAGAGRFKIGKKLSLLDRIYNRILAEDVIDVDGNVVYKEGTFISTKELEVLKGVFEAGAHMVDIPTNENMKSHSRVQVINVYVDETRKTLALFNKDWNTYKTNWQNANGIGGKIGSIFTPSNANTSASVISNDQVQILRNWNNAVKHGCTDQATFNRIIANADENTKMYFAGLNKGKGSIEGLKNAQKVATQSTIGLTIAQTALNMAITMGITALASLIMKGYDELANSVENCKERVDDLMSSYKSALDAANSNASRVEELADKYEDLSKGVK